MGSLWAFCFNNSIPCQITSIKDHVKIRKTATHSSGRAFDLRVKNLTEEQIKKVVAYLNKNFNHLGAISKSDNVRRVVVRHIGTFDHLHVQTYN